MVSMESRPGARRGRDDYCDDPRRRWKDSLRPLDPGILSDVREKKKERSDGQTLAQMKIQKIFPLFRSHSVSSVPRSRRWEMSHIYVGSL